MADQWYYQVMGEIVGPISPAELKKNVQAGKIEPQTLVRKGSSKWVPAAQVGGLLPKAESTDRAR